MPKNRFDRQTEDLILRLRQQELVAEFGLFALSADDHDAMRLEACRVAVLGLQTRFAKILEYRTASNDLLVVAGIGWQDGVVGHATLGAGLNSPAGFALQTRAPVLSNNLGEEGRFKTPTVLAEHGIHSAINVRIGALSGESYGVLEVDSTLRDGFVAEDTAFLASLANGLSAAMTRVDAARAKDLLLQEKDSLLRDKDLLMQEVHHRVKNSLQLVRTLLQLQARAASDETRAELEEAAARIMTIGAVHQRLYEGGSVSHTDAAAYLRGLMADMQAMSSGDAPRTIEVVAEPLLLPADQVTPLGLVVSELVTNALKHGAGHTIVRVAPVAAGLHIRVEDGGSGFPLNFDIAGMGGLGLRLIRAMAKGPAGAVSIDRSVPYGAIEVLLTV